MVNKREKDLLIYNFHFRQTAIPFLSFFYFIPFLLLSFSFIPYRFRLILLYLSRTYILFCRHIWAELSFLFWKFLGGTFFSGGGGVHVHPVHPPPPCVRAWEVIFRINGNSVIQFVFVVLAKGVYQCQLSVMVVGKFIAAVLFLCGPFNALHKSLVCRG